MEAQSKPVGRDLVIRIRAIAWTANREAVATYPLSYSPLHEAAGARRPLLKAAKRALRSMNSELAVRLILAFGRRGLGITNC